MGDGRIFVSHSHVDNDWCRGFVQVLQSVGYDVWYDERGLSAGAAWLTTIQREIQDREIFIVILSPNSWASDWVQDELQLALTTRRRIVPVVYKQTSIQGFLLTRQWIDATGLNFAAAARRVIVSLEQESYGKNSNAPAPPVPPMPSAPSAPHVPAQALPRTHELPSLVLARELPAPTTGQLGGVAIGLEETNLDLVYVDLISSGPHFIALGDPESGKTNLLRLWMRALEHRYTAEQVRFVLIDFRRQLLDFIGDGHLLAYACTTQMVKDCVETLKGQLDKRILSGNLTVEEIRNPKKWSGPHYFLFIDDYESLVTAAGNPLSPLITHIEQARDVGFHVVIARKVAGVARSSFEPVFQRLRESGSPGLIMNGDRMEGPLLGTQKAETLPPGRGYLVRRNQRTMLIQVALVESR